MYCFTREGLIQRISVILESIQEHGASERVWLDFRNPNTSGYDDPAGQLTQGWAKPIIDRAIEAVEVSLRTIHPK